MLSSDALSSVADTTEEVVCLKMAFSPDSYRFWAIDSVYSNGIIFLGVAPAVLVIIFKGEVDAVIPLYAVGVFTSFTLSQVGMVLRWYRLNTTG